MEQEMPIQFEDHNMDDEQDYHQEGVNCQQQ